MYVSKLSAAVAVAAFVALLTGRSDGSPFVSMSRGPMVGPQMGLPDLPPSPFGRTTCGHSGPCRPKLCMQGNVYLFASDFKTGNVYEYCEDMPPNPNTPRLTFNGIGGWGLAVSPTTQRLAVGKSGGTITIYTVTVAGALIPVGPVGKLTIGQRGAGANALGLCFDNTGGLYATNWATNELDYFTAAEVAGAGGPPAPAYTTSADGVNPFVGTYLVCDFDGAAGENYVMVDGFDLGNNYNVDVGSFTPGGGANVAITQNIGPSNGHYPGGMTIGLLDYLVVSDTVGGKLLDLGPFEPWRQPPVAVCFVPGFPATGYVSIVFDNDADNDAQREIWTSNSMGPSFSNVDAVTNHYPFFGTGCGPGESGGPTAVLQKADFYGIAVWPNAGV